MLINGKIYSFKMIISTMDVATNFIGENCEDFTVVVAEEQSFGRGRMDRIWFSEIGGLYFTVTVYSKIPIHLGNCVSLAVAIDMVESIKYLFSIKTGLKWPNDILFNDYKICGILSNTGIDKNNNWYISVGVGLNVNNHLKLLESNSTSISKIVGHDVSRRIILFTFLTAFESRVLNFEPGLVIKQWRVLNVTLNKVVKIFTSTKFIEGIAFDIDGDGKLIVLTIDGVFEHVNYGDCFY